MNKSVKTPSFNVTDWINSNCKQLNVFLVPILNLQDVIATNKFLTQLKVNIAYLNLLIKECYTNNINLTLTQSKYVYANNQYSHNKTLTFNSITKFIEFIMNYKELHLRLISKRFLYVSNIYVLNLNSNFLLPYITITFNLIME